MATETRSRGSPYGGRLFELYTKYVSEPESKKDVYGYTLLVTGYILALAGMIVYLIGQAITGEDAVFLIREIGGVPLRPG